MNADRLEAENRAEELNFATLDNDVWNIVPTWPDYDEATTAAADPYEGNVVVLTSGQTLVFDPQSKLRLVFAYGMAGDKMAADLKVLLNNS